MVVVAVAIGVYWFFFADEVELRSDYTLLDSDDKIEKGMTIKAHTEYGYGESDSKIVVESVADGVVKYKSEYESTDSLESAFEFADFSPGYWDFDYTMKAISPMASP